MKELSDPNLLPTPNLSEKDENLTAKIGKIISELVEIIRKERNFAFQAGLKEGKKLRK